MIDPAEPELFDNVHSIDEVLAIIFDLYGPDGLQHFLAMVVNSGDGIDREMLERASERLAGAGLSEAATMVCEAADDIPPKSQQNPFDPVTERALHIDWNRQHLGDWSGYLFSDDERIAKGKAMGVIQ
jgi:hypothetical protein